MLSELFKTDNEKEQSTDNANNEYYAKRDLIPVVSKGRNYRDTRECVRFNHIPHRTPSKIDYDEWLDNYYLQLDQLYKIISDNMNKKYPKNKIKWHNDNTKSNFDKLIFHCSSKHIDKFV
tara:strand:+ start:923 stop:1282 length:360 start_codon:yes stop_codon:yes gene_type:complete